ncbi:MAG: metallophosphoesterase, partial [Thermodesulfobacteriota bacterium]
MSKIKYVSLSDMHLGADNSLLTNLEQASSKTDPLKPSPVLVKLVECLRKVIGDDKPTLILNGDILELALSYTNEAAMAFERFLEQIMPDGGELFSKIVFIPGNHDHHLWEVARETQYVNYIERQIETGTKLSKPWHITRM